MYHDFYEPPDRTRIYRFQESNDGFKHSRHHVYSLVHGFAYQSAHLRKKQTEPLVNIEIMKSTMFMYIYFYEFHSKVYLMCHQAEVTSSTPLSR